MEFWKLHIHAVIEKRANFLSFILNVKTTIGML